MGFQENGPMCGSETEWHIRMHGAFENRTYRPELPRRGMGSSLACERTVG